MRITLALVFVLMVFLSCKDNLIPGPAEVYYGEDICERCKMIISEKAFAAQYTLPGGAARKFDDLGCMIHYISEGGGGQTERSDITAFFVTDYKSGEWIDGARAYYVWTESIKTPMGHGIIAVSDENSAREISERENGKFLGGFTEATKTIQDESKR